MASILEPKLDKTQKYAVGLMVEGGGFTALHSYASEEQLRDRTAVFFEMLTNRKKQKTM